MSGDRRSTFVAHAVKLRSMNLQLLRHLSSALHFNVKLSDDFAVLTGILFVIALGVLIGVIAGVLMLLAVLAYLRQ